MLDILVNVGSAADSGALDYALAMAAQHQAFLTGLQIVPVCPSLITTPEELNSFDALEKAASARRDWWLARCAKAGVRGDWEVMRGTYINSLARRSRLADLSIIDLSTRHSLLPVDFDDLSLALLSGTGPLLTVPDGWDDEWQARRVTIAWNGSGEATRAAKAALPLLLRAEAVQVLDGEPVGVPGFTPSPLRLRDWLRHHGVAAAWQPFNTSQGTGPAMIEAAKDFDADLLVMGAWGQTRLAELVLGGATRHLLRHADFPLLLAH